MGMELTIIKQASLLFSAIFSATFSATKSGLKEIWLPLGFLTAQQYFITSDFTVYFLTALLIQDNFSTMHLL